MSTKDKLVILYSECITDSALGSTRTLFDLAKLLSNKYEVKVFSLGKIHKKITKESIIEEIFKSKTTTDSRTLKTRIIDYTALIFFNEQLSYNIMNNNKELINTILSYKPDIIITLGRVLVDLVLKIKNSLPNVITISITDDFRVVENSIKIRKTRFIENNKGIKLKIKFPLFNLTSKRYLQFSKKIYEKMINNFDGIAFVTKIDEEFSEKRYPNHKSKFFVLPTASFPKELILEKPKYPINDKIKNIVFIGNCKHEPNTEAMFLIETKIAPQLKDKNFILIGSNCEKKMKNNVSYTGFISEKEKDEILNKADLCIAPLKNGSGIKVKVLEYFAKCKVVIGTSVAFEGYNIKNKEAAIIEDDISKYQKLILELEKNKNLREKIANSSNTICNYFSYSETEKRWVNAINLLGKINKKNFLIYN
ncbi:MAG: glycosyltransferase [Candidatus Micrarchaeaceae archaeon]